MYKIEDLIKKAKHYDDILDCFFIYSWEEYNIYDQIQDDSIEITDFDSYISREFLPILNKRYCNFIKNCNTEDLFIIDIILLIKSSYYNFNPCDYEDRIYVFYQNESFEKILKRFNEEEVLKYFNDMEISSINQFGDEQRWKFSINDDDELLNFAKNESCWGEICDRDIVKKFITYDNTITLHSIQFDYTIKCEGVYHGLLSPDISPDKTKAYAYDYVELTELVLKGKYRVNGSIIDYNSMDYAQGDHRNDINIIIGAALSYHTCLVYFINYITNKDSKSLNQFLNIIYLTLKNLESEYVFEKCENINEKSSIINIYNFIKNQYEVCQVLNHGVNMKLNCIPADMNTGYSAFGDSDKVSRLSSIYINSEVSKYIKMNNLKNHKYIEYYNYLAQNDLGHNFDHEFIERYIENNREYEKHSKIYYGLYGLGISLELLYILNEALTISNSDQELDFSLKRLSFKIQDYIYEDRGYDLIESQLRMFSKSNLSLKEKKYIIDKHNKFLYLFEKEIENIDSIPALMNLKSKHTNQILNWGVDPETEDLFFVINNKIIKTIEAKVSLEEIYHEIYNRVSKQIEFYKERILMKIKLYLKSDYDEDEWTNSLNSITRALSTGEYLYEVYVTPFIDFEEKDLPLLIKTMDYSCVALEYYTAIEQLATILMFLPYRTKVLEPIFKQIGRNKDKFKKLEGYFGGIGDPSKLIDYNSAVKKSIELGSLKYLYKDMSSDKSFIKVKYKEIRNFFNEMNLDEERGMKISTHLDEVRILRNKCAHGGNILDINSALKAQDVVYNHLPNPDQRCKVFLADNCHSLANEILEWYTKDLFNL